jgi:hypothetical protein
VPSWPVSQLDDLATEVEAAELEAEIALRRSQLAAGTLPPDAHRSLYPWEQRAQTNFAALNDDAARSAEQIAAQLGAVRSAMIRLLEADLVATADQPGPRPGRVAVLLRLLQLNGPLGLQAVEGSTDLIRRSVDEIRATLGAAAAAGFTRLLSEAEAQGLEIEHRAVKLSGEAEWRLDVLAEHLATQPQVDLLTALVRQALTLPVGGDAGLSFLGQLLKAGEDMSAKPLETQARSAVNSATGMGRQSAAATLPQPKEIYASELLDQNTCAPCSMIDGHSYDSLEDGLADYPNGQYADCEGGPNCRGTLVMVWGSEEDPTA